MPDASPAVSLYAVCMRLSRLDATGAPIVGPDMMYVTDSLVRVNYTPRYETTDAVTKRNGRGKLCLNVPGRRQFAGMDLSLEVCEDDPALVELLQGGSVLTTGAGADVIGYQFPGTDEADATFGLEVWTEAWNGDSRDAVHPYFRYVLPLCSVSQGERSLAAEPDENTYEGTASANAAWGNGPVNDWTHDSTKALQWIRTATPPPAATNAYAVVPPSAP
jgi:hypothetical protein